MLIDDVLYKHDHLLPYLRCLTREEIKHVLKGIHEGVYKNHLDD